MTGALLASVALIGLVGAPHCAGMCGTACVAVSRACGARRPTSGVLGVLLGRLLGYAVAGALAASFVLAVRWLSIGTGWLGPVWSALQFFLAGLGLWLLWQGRLPAVIEAWVERHLYGMQAQPDGWQRVRMPGEVKAVGAGLLWPLVPCGLLQSALLLAAMASSPWEGALLMTVFGLTSMLGVAAGAWAWLKWLPSSAEEGRKARSAWPIRLTGLMLTVSAGWTLMHAFGLTEQAPWCA